MTMVDMDVVDDDITYVLQRNAATADDVDIGAAAVQGFVAVEDEFLREFDEHIGREDDPQRLRLYHGVS